MTFLEIEDFETLIEDKILQQIIHTNTALLDMAELMSIEEVSSYLRSRFDTDEIFQQSGSNRNKQLVMIMIDVVLFHLHSRVSPRNISELRVDRYNNAIAWLKMTTKGTVMPNLPTKKNEEGKSESRLRYGSNPKLNLRF